MTVCCERCGAHNCRKTYRLDPRNWRERYKRLCTPCSRRLGYTPVDHARGYMTFLGRRAA